MTSLDPSSRPRPVSLAAILTVLAGFAIFLVLTCWTVGRHPLTPDYGSAEGVPADQAWQASAQGRRGYLLELQGKQEKQLASYGWVDRKAGVVQLPIDRAMQLVAQQYSRRK